MRLNNFLQLINDLNPNYKLYFKQEKNGPKWSISKIFLSSNKCNFIATNHQPKTIEKTIILLGKTKNKNIPLLVNLNDKSLNFFGIQIDPANNAIYLL